MPRTRAIDYVTILPVYWLLAFLIWPAFVGAWLGRPRSKREL